MFRWLLAAAVLALPVSGFAQEKKDPLPELLAKLRNPSGLPNNEPMRLTVLADFLSEKHDLPVTIGESAFRNQGIELAELTVNLPKAQLPLGATLRVALADKDATYLVRRSYIEIVPVAVAAKEAKLAPDEEGLVRLTSPLVTAIYSEKPLNEVLADLAEESDLTIVVAPQAADKKASLVTARLLNVPANQAIELLALQADLRVVKKGAGFFVTSQAQAQELYKEALVRRQERIQRELELAGLKPFGPFPAK